MARGWNQMVIKVPFSHSVILWKTNTLAQKTVVQKKITSFYTDLWCNVGQALNVHTCQLYRNLSINVIARIKLHLQKGQLLRCKKISMTNRRSRKKHPHLPASECTSFCCTWTLLPRLVSSPASWIRPASTTLTGISIPMSHDLRYAEVFLMFILRSHFPLWSSLLLLLLKCLLDWPCHLRSPLPQASLEAAQHSELSPQHLLSSMLCLQNYTVTSAPELRIASQGFFPHISPVLQSSRLLAVTHLCLHPQAGRNLVLLEQQKILGIN